MIRRSLMVVAFLAVGALVAVPAQAGEPGVKSRKVPIRFKNIGVQPVLVNAKGGSGNTGGGVALSQNGVYKSDLKAGAFTAYATGLTNQISNTLQGTANKNPIYLFVEADATATTITVAPPF